MYTVVFFTEEEVVNGNGFDHVITRHEIEIGKSSFVEAYDVAIANGADPFKKIEFINKH